MCVIAPCYNAAAQGTPTTLTPTTSASTSSGPELGDLLENLGRLYKNENDPLIQEAWLLGRYHGQYHWTEANTGYDDGYETRRFRLGGQARMFKNLTVHAQMLSGSDIDPFYNGFTELWAQWQFSPAFAVTIGQQKNRFTHDRNVSSRYLNYLERSMLTNMFKVEYTPAITIQGKVDRLTYYTGFFTNATGQNIGDAFTDFNSGYSYIAQTYYDLGAMSGFDDITLYASYLHSDFNQNATNMNYFENGLSGAVIMTKGHFALITELTSGLKSANGNATGINIQPSYFINHYLQIATRYQLAHSNENDGLKPQKRYESPAGFTNGDLYQAAYLGLNYYIAKHRLKLMTGIEFSEMDNQAAWTASTMLRFYFGPHSGGAFPMNQILPLEHD